jgi:hypothetical protein
VSDEPLSQGHQPSIDPGKSTDAGSTPPITPPESEGSGNETRRNETLVPLNTVSGQSPETTEPVSGEESREPVSQEHQPPIDPGQPTDSGSTSSSPPPETEVARDGAGNGETPVASKTVRDDSQEPTKPVSGDKGGEPVPLQDEPPVESGEVTGASSTALIYPPETEGGGDRGGKDEILAPADEIIDETQETSEPAFDHKATESAGQEPKPTFDPSQSRGEAAPPDESAPTNDGKGLENPSSAGSKAASKNSSKREGDETTAREMGCSNAAALAKRPTADKPPIREWLSFFRWLWWWLFERWRLRRKGEREGKGSSLASNGAPQAERVNAKQVLSHNQAGLEIKPSPLSPALKPLAPKEQRTPAKPSPQHEISPVSLLDCSDEAGGWVPREGVLDIVRWAVAIRDFCRSPFDQNIARDVESLLRNEWPQNGGRILKNEELISALGYAIEVPPSFSVLELVSEEQEQFRHLVQDAIESCFELAAAISGEPGSRRSSVGPPCPLAGAGLSYIWGAKSPQRFVRLCFFALKLDAVDKTIARANLDRVCESGEILQVYFQNCLASGLRQLEYRIKWEQNGFKVAGFPASLLDRYVSASGVKEKNSKAQPLVLDRQEFAEIREQWRITLTPDERKALDELKKFRDPGSPAPLPFPDRFKEACRRMLRDELIVPAAAPLAEAMREALGGPLIKAQEIAEALHGYVAPPGLQVLRIDVNREEGKAFCFTCGPDEGSIRKAHEALHLPYDSITEVKRVTGADKRVTAGADGAQQD